MFILYIVILLVLLLTSYILHCTVYSLVALCSRAGPESAARSRPSTARWSWNRATPLREEEEENTDSRRIGSRYGVYCLESLS